MNQNILRASFLMAKSIFGNKNINFEGTKSKKLDQIIFFQKNYLYIFHLKFIYVYKITVKKLCLVWNILQEGRYTIQSDYPLFFYANPLVTAKIRCSFLKKINEN